MKHITVGGYNRISKKAAEKRYNAGETVRICACNMSPVNVWSAYADVTAATADSRDFDRVINAFTYYNCNRETGYYPAYYVREV